VSDLAELETAKLNQDSADRDLFARQRKVLALRSASVMIQSVFSTKPLHGFVGQSDERTRSASRFLQPRRLMRHLPSR